MLNCVLQRMLHEDTSKKKKDKSEQHLKTGPLWGNMRLNQFNDDARKNRCTRWSFTFVFGCDSKVDNIPYDFRLSLIDWLLALTGTFVVGKICFGLMFCRTLAKA